MNAKPLPRKRLTIDYSGTISPLDADQMISANVTAVLPGTYDWEWDNGCNYGGGMLAPGGKTVCTVGAAHDNCVNHLHFEPCCDCPEHAGWTWAEDKTNVIRQVSAHLDVRLDGGAVGVGQKLCGPTALSVGGAQLSVSFGDARIVASHALHPSDTVTSSWTVAAIGLEPPTYTAGHYPIRGGTGCVSRVTILNDSALAEGSMRLDAGSGGLRFSATEGAPWADAQALRSDTPPASVGASRDFWLGASAGGTHTLEYSLRTPQGAACLATNLAIEAIVAKFATNVYYAAYGQTNEIHVGLSSASHDPAGYTLRLDGSLCATGQPPWLLPVSNLTAGTHSLTLHSGTFPDCWLPHANTGGRRRACRPGGASGIVRERTNRQGLILPPGSSGGKWPCNWMPLPPCFKSCRQAMNCTGRRFCFAACPTGAPRLRDTATSSSPSAASISPPSVWRGLPRPWTSRLPCAGSWPRA